jgi:phage tail-like protein
VSDASDDPLRNYNFKLLITGVVQGHFTAVDGLGVQVDRILYREAGNHSVVRSLPGRVEYPEVTLRYGLTSSTELWEWMMASVSGSVDRRNISIAMLDASASDEVLRWNLSESWPTRWMAAPLDALSSDVAIESMSLAFEGLELDGG